MSHAWIYPFVILGGVLQAAGAPINGVSKASLVNPWLASAISFMLGTFLAIALFWIQPTPLPTLTDLKDMKWWAPLGGIVGAVCICGTNPGPEGWCWSNQRADYLCKSDGLDCH
jgi:transporter family-2 protein